MADKSSWDIPSLATVVARVKGDLNSRLGTTRALVSGTREHSLALVLAGATHALHEFASDRAAALMPDLATGDDLDRHGDMWGIDRIPAAQAAGNVLMNGTGTVDAGTILVREDGWRYSVDTTTSVVGLTTVAVTSVETGDDGNADYGTGLTLESPIAGIDSVAVVTGTDGLSGGRDEETDDAYRTRILQRIQETPQGGAEADYEAWTLACPDGSAERVWVESWGQGAGSVVVRFAIAQTDPADPTTIEPSSAQITAVQTYLDDDTRRPVTARVYVYGIDADPIPMTIALTPDTTAVREAVEAALDAMFGREGEPSGTIANSVVRAAISNASGESSHILSSIDGDGTGLSDVVVSSTQVPVRGTITWV